MTPLCELAKKYGTDKYHPHHYTEYYYGMLSPRRNTVKRLVEIGIRTGASLRMWRDFFPNAEIIGIDRNEKYLFSEPRITCYQASQAKAVKLGQLCTNIGGNFDIIIDDGSHIPDKQISAFGAMLPYLRPDGIYFIEDIRGAGDVERIQHCVPPSHSSSVFVGKKPLPKHGHEKMLIIWQNKI
jgi:demethylmacrocin O-methyltransferase